MLTSRRVETRQGASKRPAMVKVSLFGSERAARENCTAACAADVRLRTACAKKCLETRTRVQSGSFMAARGTYAVHRLWRHRQDKGERLRESKVERCARCRLGLAMVQAGRRNVHLSLVFQGDSLRTSNRSTGAHAHRGFADATKVRRFGSRLHGPWTATCDRYITDTRDPFDFVSFRRNRSS